MALRIASRRRAAAVPPSAAEPVNPVLATPLADSPSFLVRLAQLRAFDEFHRQFAGLGVTPARFSVFALIASNPGVRPGTIAEELRIKPSNVAALVNSLVADGLVERTQDARELRASRLVPTRAGVRAYRDMERTHHEADTGFVQSLSEEERATLIALLRKLLHR